jgi:hypothetical protein
MDSCGLLTISLRQARLFINLHHHRQTSMMSRGTKRRAAAKEAENKISATLEELMGWSESKEDSFEAFLCVLCASEPEDVGSSSKKPKIVNTKPAIKESQKNPLHKKTGLCRHLQEQAEERHQGWVNKEVADPALIRPNGTTK